MALVALAASTASRAQSFTNLRPPPDEVWGENIAMDPGASGIDWAIDVIQTKEGGFLSAGFAQQAGEASLPSLTKLRADGSVEWKRVYSDGLPLADGWAYQAIPFMENGQQEYVAVGAKRLGFYVNAYIVKVDSEGNQIGPFHYVECDPPVVPGISYGDSISPTADGGFIVTGRVFTAATYADVLLAKLDAAGNTLWCRNFSGDPATPVFDLGASVQPTYSGGKTFCGGPKGTPDGYILTGESTPYIYVVRTDTMGNLLWSRLLDESNLSGYSKIFTDTGPCSPSVGDPTTNRGIDVIQSRDGNFVVSAELNRYEPAVCGSRAEYLDADGALIKLDRDTGDVIFAKNIAHFSGGDFSPRVREIPSGLGFVVVGTTADQTVMSDTTDGAEILLVRTNAQGDVIWRKPFLAAPTASHGNCGFGVAVTRDGGYVVSGNNGDDGDDFVFARLERDSTLPGRVLRRNDCTPQGRRWLGQRGDLGVRSR